MVRFRRSLPALLGLAILVPSTPALAGSDPSVSVNLGLGECSYSGTAIDFVADTVRVVHRDTEGQLKREHTLPIVASSWSVDCPGPRIKPGDTLRVFDGAGTTPIRTFTVPGLTAKTDRARDRVTGVAERTTQVSVAFASCDAASFGCTKGLFESVPVDPGTHRYALTSDDDIKGGWFVTIAWLKGNDEVTLSQRVAQLIVRPGVATVAGTGRAPGTTVAVSVRRGQAVGTASPTAGADASFRGVVKRSGTFMKPRAGDLVSSSMAGDATLTVPQTSMTVGIGMVSGRCFQNRPVTVLIRNAAGNVIEGHIIPATNGVGDWSVGATFLSGDTVEAWCATNRGDVVKVVRVVV